MKHFGCDLVLRLVNKLRLVDFFFYFRILCKFQGKHPQDKRFCCSKCLLNLNLVKGSISQRVNLGLDLAYKDF